MRSDLHVRRDDLARTRWADEAVPRPGPGQVLLRVGSFGLTANNITYARLGTSMGFWDFFPAPAGWGRVPVWGYAEVVEAAGEELPAGARVFGYVPMGTHLLVTVDRADAAGFVDRSPHRAGLPAAYNHYRFTEDEADVQLTVWPLFYTSYLLADLLEQAGYCGARRIVVTSASSRTALGLAFLLAADRRSVEVIGLTSDANRSHVSELGVYGRVLAYGDYAELPGPDAVLVDFTGDSGIVRAVHRRYGDSLRESIGVGATHGGAPATASPSRVFVSADRTRERAGELGLPELMRRLDTAWASFRPTAERWFPSVRGAGRAAVHQAWLDTLHGRVPPGAGYVLSL